MNSTLMRKIVFTGNASSDDSQIVKYQFNFGDSRETDWIGESWIEYYYEEPGELYHLFTGRG